MNSAKEKAIHILAVIFVAAIMIVTMVMPAVAQQGPEIRVTHSEEEADQPDVAIDSKGNVHIAYCDWVGEESSYEIFYTMLNNSGGTLIDDTLISDDDDYKSKRPAIAVDSRDKVHIVWQDKRWDGGTASEITYTKLDPSRDTQDGDAANAAQITEIDDTRLTDIGSENARTPRIAVDSNDDIHIVWEDNYEDSDYSYLYYMKIDENGNELVGETMVRDMGDHWRWAHPDIAVDSNNNPHIAWNDYADTSWEEVHYMMLDGSDGGILINATVITPDDNVYSKWQKIVVDLEDKVHIIWQDYRGIYSEWRHHEIYHTKLDPYEDDRNGDAANETAITLIDDTMLTADDGQKSCHPAIAIYCGRYIHVVWWEEWDVWVDYHGNIDYMVIDNNGNTVVNSTALTVNETATTTTKWTLAYLDVDCNGKAHITWCDDRDSPGNYTEVYYTSYQGPTADCCRKAPSPPPGVPTLSQWGAIGMIIALAGCIVWTLRRRKVSLNVP